MKLAEEAGVGHLFEVDSAATSREEIGNPVYPPARRMLVSHGITRMDHRARQMTMDDYRYYEYIIVMDGENLWNARRMTGGDPDDKIRMLLDRQIDDPWYTDDFETAYQDILEGMGKQFDSKLEACYKKARPEFEAYYSSGQD